jgi:hypothetical protein
MSANAFMMRSSRRLMNGETILRVSLWLTGYCSTAKYAVNPEIF